MCYHFELYIGDASAAMGLSWSHLAYPHADQECKLQNGFSFQCITKALLPTSTKDKTKYANFVKYTQLNNQSDKEL
jgi:hypothetical protein